MVWLETATCDSSLSSVGIGEQPPPFALGEVVARTGELPALDFLVLGRDDRGGAEIVGPDRRTGRQRQRQRGDRRPSFAPPSFMTLDPASRAAPSAHVETAPHPAQPLPEPVEIKKDDRRRIERQRLAEQQAADDGYPQRMTQFRPLAGPERQRQGAEHGGEGRHHDRAEAQQAGLGDRLARLQPLAPGLEGEVDHHDRVLLDDADQQNDADRGDDRELDAEQTSARSARRRWPAAGSR